MPVSFRMRNQEKAEEEDRPKEKAEEVLEKPISLNEQRLGAVVASLRASGAKRVLDLGCGEGKLLRELLKDKQFEEIVGLDVSIRTLEMAQRRLKVDRLPTMQANRLKLIHGSLMYRDKRLEGFDAAAVVEVVEHLDPPRLSAFERVLFEFARPTDGRADDAEPGVQRDLGNASSRAVSASRPPLRVDPQEFQGWATGHCRAVWLCGAISRVGTDTPRRGSLTRMGVLKGIGSMSSSMRRT